MRDGNGQSIRLLTPAGVGAIAVIQMSGSGAWSALRDAVRSRHGLLPTQPVINHLYYGRLHDGEQDIDDVILRAVASDCDRADAFSGVVEVNCHGGVGVVSRVMEYFAAVGFDSTGGDAAFGLTDPPSILEREVLRLLSRVTTRRAGLFLLRQLELLPAFFKNVLELLESGDHDRAIKEISRLLARSRSARHLYETPTIAVVGPVNAGKSSLVNRLAGRNAAIAADRPGATLDYVTVEASIDGVAMRLMDTPGSGGPPDTIHQSAQDSARLAAKAADLRLVVVDAGCIATISPSIWNDWASGGPWLWVVNKIDLAPAPELPVSMRGRVIGVSSRSGEGLETLGRAIVEALGVSQVATGGAVAVGGMIETLESAIEAPTSEKLSDAIRSIIEKCARRM